MIQIGSGRTWLPPARRGTCSASPPRLRRGSRSSFRLLTLNSVHLFRQAPDDSDRKRANLAATSTPRYLFCVSAATSAGVTILIPAPYPEFGSPLPSGPG